MDGLSIYKETSQKLRGSRAPLLAPRYISHTVQPSISKPTNYLLEKILNKSCTKNKIKDASAGNSFYNDKSPTGIYFGKSPSHKSFHHRPIALKLSTDKLHSAISIRHITTPSPVHVSAHSSSNCISPVTTFRSPTKNPLIIRSVGTYRKEECDVTQLLLTEKPILEKPLKASLLSKPAHPMAKFRVKENVSNKSSITLLKGFQNWCNGLKKTNSPNKDEGVQVNMEFRKYSFAEIFAAKRRVINRNHFQYDNIRKCLVTRFNKNTPQQTLHKQYLIESQKGKVQVEPADKELNKNAFPPIILRSKHI